MKLILRSLFCAFCIACSVIPHAKFDSSAAVASEAKGELPRTPFLRINSEMHTGWIKRIGVDRACRLLVTAGRGDKTARLWSLPENEGEKPELVRVFRHPIGPGNEGKVYAVAMSPDGRLAALGGWDVNPLQGGVGLDYVYIFDTVSGRLLQRLGGLSNVIHHLAFSLDGHYLVAGLHSNHGVRVWDVASWTLVGKDSQYNGDIYGAAFDDLGRLYTVSYDGKLRRYSPPFKRAAHLQPDKIVETTAGKYPLSLSIHPTGDRLAVGFKESPAVAIYDTGNLKRLFIADTNTKFSKKTGSTAVTWSMDGKTLFAALSPTEDVGPKTLQIWDEKGQQKAADTTLRLSPVGSVVHMLPCGSNVAMAANGAFGLLDPDGKRRQWRDQEAAILSRDKGQEGGLLISRDGSRVRFGLEHGGKNPVLFDLEGERLVRAKGTSDDLFKADTTSLKVTDWEYSQYPKLNGDQLMLEDNESAVSLAVAPSKKLFVLGTTWRLHAFDRSGNELWIDPVTKRAIPAQSAVLGLNISNDGRLFVAAYSDGTIRWHRLSDGKELLALFVHSKDMRWIAWTPTGYYMASVGGEDLIGWHVNRGWRQAADFFPVHRFRKQFHRPDIVKRVLKTLDEESAIKEAGVERDAISEILPPVVTLHNLRDGSDFFAETIEVEYSVRSPSGLKVTKLVVRSNGVIVGQRQFDTDTELGKRLRMRVRLLPRDTLLSLKAYAGTQVSVAETVSLKWTGKAPVEAPVKPMLFALVIGINYEGKTSALNWAAQDAIDMVEKLKSQPVGEKGLYRDVDIRSLINGQATKHNIITEMKRLYVDMTVEQRRSEGKSEDTVIVFFSGHGLLGGGRKSRRFFLIPADAESILPESYAISEDTLLDYIDELPGRKVLMIDACRAGSVIKGLPKANIASFANAVADLGVYVFASTASGDLSIECDGKKNGCFTEAVLEGLSGEADKFPLFDFTNTGELDTYLDGRVWQLSGYRHTAVSGKSKPFRHFYIAGHD